MDIKIGFDPEVFLVDNNGKFISAVGLVGGSKTEPKDIGSGHYVQEDNVAVEFNTPPVNVFSQQPVEQIRRHFQYVFDWLVRNVCAPNNLQLSKAASAIFDEDQLQTEAAKTFGCDPDYNAYNGLENPKPKGPEGLRTCGGHIHIGYASRPEEVDFELNKLIIKYLDYKLGVASVLHDPDARRRELYGKAGAYRDKSYGVEYRTLSNYWIFTESGIRSVVEAVQDMVRWCVSPAELKDQLTAMLNDMDNSEEVQACIDYNDKRLAEYLTPAKVESVEEMF